VSATRGCKLPTVIPMASGDSVEGITLSVAGVRQWGPELNSRAYGRARFLRARDSTTPA
jgi:hypothetical protein